MNINGNIYSKYPYFKEQISIRLAEEKCQVRNLIDICNIIDFEGSAHHFLSHISGLNTVKDILLNVSHTFNLEADIIEKDFLNILSTLLKNKIISFSKTSINKTKKYLNTVAKTIKNSIHLDITHRCNENCIHCLVNKDNKESNINQINDTIQQAAEYGFTTISFSGGEPFLHPDIWNILEYSKEYGFYFTLFTNGINLTDNDYDKIASLYPEKVRISLYSMDENIHDRITNLKGSFEKTMKTIHSLKDRSVRLYINSPIMNINFDGYRKIAEFCDELGIEKYFDPVIQPTRDLRKRNTKLQLVYNQAKDVTGFQQDADILIVNIKKGIPVCNAGNDPSIDADLNIYPCPGLRIKLGNLKEKTLNDILLNNKIIEETGRLSLDDLEICQKCDVKEGCYRCHGHAFQDNKSIYACSTSDRRQAKIRKELIIERQKS